MNQQDEVGGTPHFGQEVGPVEEESIVDYSPLTPASVENSGSQQQAHSASPFGNEDETNPICSVLNTVIDYVMEPPTIMEPEELLEAQRQEASNKEKYPQASGGKSSKEPLLLVPVIRVFGPILRRDLPVDHPPVQSSCLYIHGAFPYLLARPRLAGPDGSIHQKSDQGGLNPTNSHHRDHMDWDDPAMVERFLPQLQEKLEASIQSTSQSFGGEGAKSGSKEPKAAVARVIRRLSVVMGRGFYTYCQGPPAPFVRVEYYNPSDRWKVKRALEKGLDSTPVFYHPDSIQYDPFGRVRSHERAYSSVLELDDDEDSEAEAEISEILQFHCYEAHIPYTMQFFKDWNLAGMSYIHVSGGLFRDPLPRSLRPHHRPSYMASCDEERKKVPADFLFLRSNTPENLKWSSTIQSKKNEEDNTRSQETKTSDSQSSRTSTTAASVPPREHLPSKDTTCDVELDVSVDHILNVLDVMTKLPETKEEREKVHWRAVPSLREIWKEERLRMSKLLPPELDFLSNDSQEEPPQPAFTLSVKGENTPMPGTRLAVEGMKKLLRVSEGLEEDFNRAMKQIMERYANKVDHVDHRLNSRVIPTPSGKSQSSQMQLTPTENETFQALLGLGGKETTSPVVDGVLSDKGGSGWAGIHANPALRSAEKFVESTSHYYDPNNFSQSQEHNNEYDMSQRVENGESIIQGPFQQLEDWVDPKTLRPFDLIDDDSIIDDDVAEENDLEKELSLMATQTLEMMDSNDGEVSDYPPSNTRYNEDEKSFGSNDLSSAGAASNDEILSDPVESIHNETPIDMKETNSDTIRLPPTRQEATDSALSTRLLPLPPKKSAPEWMKHLNIYNEERKRWASSSVNLNGWFHDKESGGLASLTRGAPSRRLVVAWNTKQSRKLGQRAQSGGGARKKSRMGENDDLLASMAVDGNSRKLVATEKQDSLDVEMGADFIRGRQVEEVKWNASQPNWNASQLSQREVRTPAEPNPEAMNTSGCASEKSSGLGTDDLSSSLKSSTTPQSNIDDEGGALQGMGNQGGKLWVAGGGQLKAKTRPSQIPLNATIKRNTVGSDSYLPTPITVMSIEVHVQCRAGRAGVNDSKQIAMVPNSERDRVSAVVFVVARDPGGGESLEYLERGCIFIPVEREIPRVDEKARRVQMIGFADRLRRAIPIHTMGVAAPVSSECVDNERSLLLRLAAKVHSRDPDMLLSWDTQAAGIGYLVERGIALGRTGHELDETKIIDMAKLLGRTHKDNKKPSSQMQDEFESTEKQTPGTGGLLKENQFTGSSLGAEWDDRVGAGSAAASISGRLVFAAWKIVAEEVKHANASYMPAIVSTVLGRRIPFHDNIVLTQWYGHNSGRDRWRVVHYRLVQAMSSMLLFEALDIVGRAGEASRLSGVEFSQSFPGIRGSQYKVEGVLLRALKSLDSGERGKKRGKRAKCGSAETESCSSTTMKSQTQSPWKTRRRKASGTHGDDDEDLPMHELNDRGYFFFSPSLGDSDRQEALEVQALTLEPESGHYEDPIVVCDFTALYPSLIIAYNLCYSTCAGRLEYHSTRREMQLEGKTTGSVSPFTYEEGRTATVLRHHLKSLSSSSENGDRAYAAPTGTIYVAESVVKGVLPQVLDEMLSTRAMLKKAAKEYKRLVPNLSPSILRQLEARQLALKYVANVTYGYTSATFSGRCAMPLLADSIVECARRTLKNAINLANSWGASEGGRWQGCKVLYGDTDSVFVRLPGRSVREAFQFGEEFCKAVTASNPPPVQLKLEKVYLGCILQTKKKYCGMKFESPNQPKPEFEAKGIETVRRDQCALTQKILRNSLITLFNRGTAAVKRYLFRQWSLIISGELPVSDFILTGRVKSRYRGSGVGPVQAVLARRLAEADPGRVMRHKERIAYVIVATPGRNFRLRDGVLTPNELLEQWDAYVLNTTYYITKLVNPALQRCLGLAPHKIDVNSLYNSMPKPRRRVHFWPATVNGSTGALSRFFANSNCVLCGGKGTVHGHSRVAVCHECGLKDLNALETAFHRLNLAQDESLSVANQCSKCHLGFEDSGTYAGVRSTKKKQPHSFLGGSASAGVYTPLSACSCTDCPVSFQRHRLREVEYEAIELCKALGGDDVW